MHKPSNSQIEEIKGQSEQTDESFWNISDYDTQERKSPLMTYPINQFPDQMSKTKKDLVLAQYQSPL